MDTAGAVRVMVLTGIAVGALVLWVMLGVVLARLPAPGDPEAVTGDGDEPPALVNFLVNRCRVTRPAYPATILDLASRGYLTVTDRGGQPWCSGPRGAVDAARLDPVDAQVLSQVGDRLSGVDGAPFVALAGGQSGVPDEQWWQPFRKLVAAQARDRGLAARRLSARQRLVLLAAAVPVVILVATASAGYDPSSPGPIVLLSVFLVPAMVFSVRGDKLTRTGLASAARWAASAGRYRTGPGDPDLARAAYAVAFGVPHPAAVGFTASGRPRAAWSSMGGTWRLVAVDRCPRRIHRVPIWSWVSMAPLTAVLVELYSGLPGYRVPIALVLAALSVAVLVHTAVWLTQFLSTPRMIEFDGVMIARWQDEDSNSEGPSTVHYGAVDDGTQAWTWLLEPYEHRQVTVGSTVHVLANRHRGKLLDLRVRAVPTAPGRLAPVLAANQPAPGRPNLVELTSAPAIELGTAFTVAGVSRVLGRSMRLTRARRNLLVLKGGGLRLACLALPPAAGLLAGRLAGQLGPPVPELGAEARLARRGQALVFRSGSTLVQLTLRGMPPAESAPALVALGRLATTAQDTRQVHDRPPAR